MVSKGCTISRSVGVTALQALGWEQLFYFCVHFILNQDVQKQVTKIMGPQQQAKAQHWICPPGRTHATVSYKFVEPPPRRQTLHSLP